ncbi:hypothetical protein F1B92_01180 [Campylobacter sp. FMV-PI01]|uniref:Uncharacterized protein n=1 Tax=Campylobacter portucalensis TaxID=2608384 RepID=A0A6L5WFI9_9BACT|nr:hypothetical protein [Campylobacter portucalensis]MSN95818.1 hypothetical protein [Campylobacter portucalensis]
MKELQIALNYENEGILLYSELFNKFGCEIFNQILEIKKSGLNLLQNFKTDESLDEIAPQNLISLKDGIILALTYENKASFIYDDITNSVTDNALRDIFFRLWATSENEYKKALNLELSKCEDVLKQDFFGIENLKQFGLNLDVNSIKELSKILKKLKNGKASQNEIQSFLNHPYFSFLLGAGVGALGGIFINEILKEKI